MFRNIRTIAAKEIKDALRDSSSLSAVFIYTLMGPIMLFFIVLQVDGNGENVQERSIRIIGGDHPVISSYLADNGYSHDEDAKVTLIIPQEIENDLANSEQGTIRIEADLTRETKTVNALKRTLESLNESIVADRLVERNIPEDFIVPIDVVMKNSSNFSFMESQIIMFLTFGSFVAISFTAMSLSIDMTAGERERLSFEPLLAQPVKSMEIMVGKWFVGTLLTIAGVALTIFLMALVLTRMPSDAAQFSLDLTLGSKMFIVLIPLSMLMAALQLGLALLAKSYKEGITFLGVAGLIPMSVPFLGLELAEEYSFLPFLSEVVMINNVITGSDIGLMSYAIAVSGIVILTYAALYYSQWRLKQETVFS